MIHQDEKYNKDCQCSSGRIPDDEPVFLLRAQDATAAKFVGDWANYNFNKYNITQEKFNSLIVHALAMEDWENQKNPD